MTQNAIVTAALSDGLAEVSVLRASACGGDCASCGGCSGKNIIKAIAKNAAGARPGDRVTLMSKNASVIGAAALVYVLPIAMFFIGYAVSASLSLGENASIALSMAFFAAGVASYVLINKFALKNRQIEFIITSVEE